MQLYLLLPKAILETKLEPDGMDIGIKKPVTFRSDSTQISFLGRHSNAVVYNRLNVNCLCVEKDK
jgi:hypothetical protein